MAKTIAIIKDGDEWISPTDERRHPSAVRAVMAELRSVYAAEGRRVSDEWLEAKAVATLRNIIGFENVP